MSSSSSSASSASAPTLGIRLPPVKERSEVLRDAQQQAAIPDGAIREGLESEMPPVIRSVLELSHLMMSGHSQWLRGAPGYQGGLFHRGSPYCFASGYRDNHRPREVEERGNHMKLKDPLLYGPLSLPITAAYLCELHGRGIFDLNKPLVEYLPEMEEKIPSHVTGRTVLSFSDALDDRLLVREMTKSRLAIWKPRLSWNACASAQKHLYQPITHFLTGSSGSAKASHCSSGKSSTPTAASASVTVMGGEQQRKNLYYYLTASRSPGSFFRRVSAHRAAPSHFSIALLLHAVETQLKKPCFENKCGGSNFEESIRKLFFERAESHGAGYGVPKLWRNPQELFYQPTGLALQHTGFKRPIPSGAAENCGPAVFNGSLNMYAPSEDYGKLLLLSLDTIRDAQTIFGPLSEEICPSASSKPYYDFGIRVVPSKRELHLLPSFAMISLDWVPTSASFRYACDFDLGCFGIASCGSRSARLFALNLSRLIQHLYLKHALDGEDDSTEAAKSIDPSNPPLPNNASASHPEGSSSSTQTNSKQSKLQKVLSDHHRTKYFKKLDHHTRF